MAPSTGDPADKEETKADYKQKQKTNTNQLYTLYLFVAAIVTSSWVLGAMSFSFMWVFLLIAVLFTVWKTRVIQIIQRQIYLEEITLFRKRALKNSETSEWLNFVINRWWVFSSSTVADLIKRRIDIRLEDVKPRFLDSIELSEFTCGEQTPCFRNLKVFEFGDGIPGGGNAPLTWLSVTQPPIGLNKMSSFQLILEADVNMTSDDFKMVFRSRIGSKSVGVYMDTAVENLNINGTLQIIALLSMDVPFPHIAKLTFAFTETPEVWFNVRTLKAVQMMELPLLKTWIHTHVMEALTSALVDPGKLDVKFSSKGPVLSSRQSRKKHESATGVLTIGIKAKPPVGAGSDDVRYCVLRIGDTKHSTHEVTGLDEWEDTVSFLIYGLAQENLQIKRKHKRLITSTVIETHELHLAKFPLEVKQLVRTDIEGNDGSVFHLELQYTSLPNISLDLTAANDAIAMAKEQPLSELSGVLYICVHSGSNLLAGDRGGTSDPYCVMFSDRRRIMTTPYVQKTLSPTWDSSVEFFVSNFTKMTMSFFVYDWDGATVVDDDFLGSAHLTMTPDEPIVIKKVLTLGYTKPSEGHIEDKQYGSIIISAVFRPVPSVAKSEQLRAYYDGLSNDVFLAKSHLLKNQVGVRRQYNIEDEQILNDKLMVELTIIRGKDLVAADRNGYSDPYIDVMLGEQRLFRTKVQKKTLNPVWQEDATFQLQKDSTQNVKLLVYDKDVFGADFLGELTLTLTQLKELSLKKTADWFSLQRTKSGLVQLKASVISNDSKSPARDVNCNEKSFSRGSSSPLSDITESRPLDDSSFFGDPSASGHAPGGFPSPPSVVKHESGRPRTLSSKSQNGTKLLTLPPHGKTSSPVEKDEKRRIQSFSGWDNTSTGGDVSPLEKYYDIQGEITQISGVQTAAGPVYCKLRLDKLSNDGFWSQVRKSWSDTSSIDSSHPSPNKNRRMSSHSGRVIAKSEPCPADKLHMFNFKFHVDKGSGLPMESILVFDVKQTNKEHIATKSYPLKFLLNEAVVGQTITKLLLLTDDVILKVNLSHNLPNPSASPKRSSKGIFKSGSFRRNRPPST